MKHAGAAPWLNLEVVGRELQFGDVCEGQFRKLTEM